MRPSCVSHAAMADVTRFAPSPTGLLHLGHARAALFARRHGARCLLRIEDIDAGRCRPEWAAALIEDLEWLGLRFDGAVRVQSRHMEEFRAALGALAAMGLLYPCFCTRADIAAAGSAQHGPSGLVYPGTCRGLPDGPARVAAGAPHALRLDVAAALARTGPLTWRERGEGRLPCDAGAHGDVVLARKDVPASYHLCVAHDDALQGVTLVTRGADLRPATAIHRLLQALLGWPEPDYAHHPLLAGADGRRLAKRDGAPSLRSLRAAGHRPAEVRAMAEERRGEDGGAGGFPPRPGGVACPA